MVKIPKAKRQPKKVTARFYESATGVEPVREWLKALQAGDRKSIGDDIATLEFGWPIGMPICKPLGDGLFEIRCTLSGHRIARVFFCTTKGQLILLHGFEKKTQKSPVGELALARRRKKEIEE